jgi:hypothetical protein
VSSLPSLLPDQFEALRREVKSQVAAIPISTRPGGEAEFASRVESSGLAMRAFDGPRFAQCPRARRHALDPESDQAEHDRSDCGCEPGPP